MICYSIFKKAFIFLGTSNNILFKIQKYNGMRIIQDTNFYKQVALSALIFWPEIPIEVNGFSYPISEWLEQDWRDTLMNLMQGISGRLDFTVVNTSHKAQDEI